MDFGTVPKVSYFLFFYWILELFRQCGIFCFSIWFWNCSDSMVFFVFLLDFRTVPTVWYFLFFYWILELFRQCGIFCFSIGFWNCSDSVVFSVFLLDFGTVPSVWYFLFFYLILELFRQCGIFCSSFYLYIKYKDECILYFLLGIRKQSLIVIRKIYLGDIVVVIVW
jgi:hypothetical protein